MKLEAPKRLAVLDLVDYYGLGFMITRINVPREHRRKGVGTKILEECCREADSCKVKLFLEIGAYEEVSADILRAWYEKHGFFQENGIMTRLPR